MKSLVALGLTAALLAGCGPTEASVTGKWTGQIDQKTEQSNLGANFAKALAGTITLDIKPDHTFSMVALLPVSGKWALNGSTLTCTPEASMGIATASAKPMEFKVAGDKLEPISASPGQNFSFHRNGAGS